MAKPSIIVKIIRGLETRIKITLLSPRRWLRNRVEISGAKLDRLGSLYGGWVYASEGVTQDCTAILCGAGEDITFDLSFQRKYNANVLIIDPTPRAIQHFSSLFQEGTVSNHSINGSDCQFYELNGVDLNRLKFEPVAVWNADTSLKFWIPKHVDHVSHSILNIQKTSESIIVKAETLKTIAERNDLNLDEIEILKLDIEGAEIEVLQWMLSTTYRPKQILVEFDQMLMPDIATSKRVKRLVSALLIENYRLIYFDGASNCSFLLKTLKF